MIRIEGTRFIGATLWTDLLLEGKADEIGAHMRVSREISDFRGAIQHQGRDFSTGESVERHRADRKFIEHELEEAERAGDRAVVITHHAPTNRSGWRFQARRRVRSRCSRTWRAWPAVDPGLVRGSDPFNPAFASDLDRVIERYQPTLWIHRFAR